MDLLCARAEGRKIVWLDEVCFTKRSNQERDWSAKGQNTVLDQADVMTDFRAVIASISMEEGIEKLYLQTHAIDIVDFRTFLGKLREKNGETPLALYMDNLAVHKSDDSKMKMAELNIRPIFNPVYSPEYNPIEMVFA